MTAGDVPKRKDPCEVEYLPGTENSLDTQYLPEAESSSSHAEPVKKNLEERNHLPQVEQQIQDILGGKKAKGQ